MDNMKFQSVVSQQAQALLFLQVSEIFYISIRLTSIHSYSFNLIESTSLGHFWFFPRIVHKSSIQYPTNLTFSA